MDEDEQEHAHIVNTQVIDVTYVRGKPLQISVWFVGGQSTQELEQGGTNPGLFDITMDLPDSGAAAVLMSYLSEWMDDVAACSVIVYESGTAKITNTDSGKTLTAKFER